MSDPTRELPCDHCGRVVLDLTAAQTARVTAEPQNFIVLCGECQMTVEKRDRGGGYDTQG